MENKDKLILSNKLECSDLLLSGPEPVIKNIMSREQIENRLPDDLRYTFGLPNKIGVKLEDDLEAYINIPNSFKDKLNDSLTNQLVKTLTGIADEAWKEFEGDKLTKSMVIGWLESQLEYVIKYRPKHKFITSGNLNIYWDRIVRYRINLIKKKHTKHGKSKLIKFKTTIRMRDV